jgi:hypothetical protein
MAYFRGVLDPESVIYSGYIFACARHAIVITCSTPS